ncbi:hypothetical protein BRD00_03415 [Halobacteriales archaeon QS_8_69_26]|nr:MAG: hypothetical protein BRD00_03415 [Halobacteriales archaeon QS_8_69_26]
MVAIGAVAGLYWVGALRLLEVAFALFMLPVYYIVVACLFSVWLGYHEHASTRVYRAASRDR